MGGSVLIVNPRASGVDAETARRVLAALPGTPELARTDGPGHATALAREAVAAGAERVYVFSGDGVYNEVLNGLEAAGDVDVELGFLPGGGTSVLPRALGLPRDPVAAAARMASARPRRISLGRVNGRRFAFSAGIGFDAELVRRVDALGRGEDGRRPGDLAFARVAVGFLAERRGRFPEVLEVAGLGRSAFALVANCDPYTYAGRVPLHVAPAARFELGLDVAAPAGVRARDVPGLLAFLLRGRSAPRGLRHGHDLDEVVIRCDRPLPLQVDGEDLGDVTEALVRCERDAVTVLV